MKEDYEKALKKVVFFLTMSLSIDKQNYQKQKGPGISDQSLFRLQNKFRKFLLLVKYYLTKLDANLLLSICPSESGKCGKEGEKLQTFEYLKNEKSFLDEIKNIFCSF